MTRLFSLLLRFLKPLVWLVVITILCIMPPSNLPTTSLFEIPQFDKAIHFGMYFVMALLLVHPLEKVYPPGIARRILAIDILLISLAVGGIIEILQFAMAYQRSASWGDLVADLAGAAAGWLLYFPLLRHLPFLRILFAALR
jgi:VanZ family protein